MIDKQRIGGSDIGAILGVSPHKTGLDVYRRIVDGVDAASGNAAKRGRLLEPAVRDWLVSDMPGLALSGPSSRLIEDWGRATADDFDLASDRVVELKTVGAWAGGQWGPAGTDEIPLDYYMQVQWYCHAYKASGAIVAALMMAKDELRIYEVDAKPDVGDGLVRSAKSWWDAHVQTKTPPHPRTRAEAIELFSIAGPSEPLRPATEAESALMLAYWHASGESKKLAKSLESVKDNIRLAIGAGDGLENDSLRVTWASRRLRETVDWESVAKELGATPDIIKKHAEPGRAQRTLTIREKKNGKDVGKE